MGIATGEAELREGDYFGPVLNRAARVMACGHGGQILIDGATALLVNGFKQTKLGRQRLRDLAQPVDILQVRSPSLRGEAHEAFVRAGPNMTNAEIATYAFEQIDLARAELTR